MSTPQHVWMRPIGKRKMHLILLADDKDRFQRTACGQMVFIEKQQRLGEKCVACLRTNPGRDADQPES
jgi:hypothetical protein